MVSSSSQVRVGVRVRPLTCNEQSDGGKQIVSVRPHNNTVELLNRKFTFDGVYDESVSQSHLYSCVGADGMMEAFLEGYNATIMAYGQTGSGKTYTMGSEADYMSEGADAQREGLIPRFMNDVFESLQRRKINDQEFIDKSNSSGGGGGSGGDSGGDSKDQAQKSEPNRSQLIGYQISASFLEVYGEDIHDLLGDDSRQVLPLRENGEGGIVVVGLKEKKIDSAQDALQILHDGTLNRTTAATLMNKKSSRSHAVFTIILKQTTREYKDNDDQENGNTLDVVTVSRFTFVDLAGSERMKKTGAEGERAKEGIKINEGLLALGNVINALADEDRLTKGEKVHVPYRQSKLTRLLQDALGGNSQTLFLACVSPSDTNASETTSTLRYANRARDIKNTPTKNIDATVAELQRLYALNNVLEKELVRVRFGDEGGSVKHTVDGESIGEACDELIKSEVVQEYFKKIHEKAAESKAVARPPPVLSSQDAPSIRTIASTLSVSTAGQTSLPSTTAAMNNNKKSRQSVIQSIDQSILGVNPDEDIALLDKILELQNIDQEFDKEAKEGQKQLHEVEGELEAQEQLLLQLKNNMKGYHQLKDRFEAMMMEVQSLETEKTSLAKDLESAQVDPSKGCSKAIKKRLNDIEAKLARARNETRKNQLMYRKVEQEAQKAKVLQQKIETMKHGKVALIRKQRDAAMKHRESIDLKSREIQVLKKKERQTGHKMTKLEAEVQKHKANLQKRKNFCDKLQDKLKKTESHLMQVLALRKRNNMGLGKKSTRVVDKNAIACIDSNDAKKGFAPQSKELNSLQFLLEKLIVDRVGIITLKSSYELKVAEYSDLMRCMMAEMKLLKDAKEELSSCNDKDCGSDIEQAIRDSNQTVEDLELRLEVVENDLEHIRTKLPNIDEDDDAEEDPSLTFETDAMKMVANLNGPVVKSLLWEILDVATKSEAAKAEAEGKLKRKEAALSSFESEIQCLNQQIVHLTNDIGKRRSEGANSNDDNHDSLSEIIGLKGQLFSFEKDKTVLSKTIENNEIRLRERDVLLSTLSENLTVMDVTIKNAGIETDQKVLDTMHKLQVIWKLIGFPSDERESVRSKIESCLELSCADALEEAARLQNQYEGEILQIRADIKQIYQALGMENAFSRIEESWQNKTSTLQLIGVLRKSRAEIDPVFHNAMNRKTRIITDVESALSAMKMSRSEVCQDLAKLMKKHPAKNRKQTSHLVSNSPNKTKELSKERRATQFKHVTELVRALETEQGSHEDDCQMSSLKEVDFDGDVNEPNSLSEAFLDRCETEMKKLKMEKARIKVTNQNTREEAQQLTADMHLRGRELLSLSIHSIKKRTRELPPWWDPRTAEEVCRAIVSKKTVVKVNAIYTRHLRAVHDSLSSLSKGRKLLSQTLKDIVKNAQNTLLQTVEGELNAREAYASFDAALAGLPPLSKETVNACIDEMNTLIEAVDAMAQSEVEALTVVWDALNTSNNEKGRFWGAIEESTKAFQVQHHHNFDSVLKACTTDIEEWLLCAVKDAQKIHRTLNNSLLKLSKIHEEVQKLSTKQATKSKIISVDSEICILTAKLCEFEDKANSKQRLTRKTNSSSLLKEEKFRKQMQNNFTLKLASLSRFLNDWESIEGNKFDVKMLSTEVSTLLQNPDGVKKRTAFMHLKTTQQKTKRRTVASTPDTSNTRTTETSSDSNIHLDTNRIRFLDKTTKESSSRLSRPRGAVKESNINRLDRARSPQTSRNKRTKDRSKSPMSKQINRSKRLGTRGSIRPTSQIMTESSTIRTNSKQEFQNRRGTSALKDRISVLELNHRSMAKSTPTRERQSLSLDIDTHDSPVLPFGQVLAQTPKEKENFRF